MKTHSVHSANFANVAVIFWLGVLTGAMVVGLLFLYRTVSSGDLDAAVLRRTTVTAPKTTTTSTKTSNYLPPPPNKL